MPQLFALLSSVKNQFETLSWADLFVLAGTIALDIGATNKPVPFTFCGGRTDATEGSGSNLLQPNGGVDGMAYYRMRDTIGLTDLEAVALAGRPRSGAQMNRMGYFGSWNTGQAAVLSNQFFITLLNETWDPFTVPGSGFSEYKARGKEIYILPSDIALRWDANTLAIAQDFASDNTLFLSTFATAWTKVVNIDRFDGPVNNICNTKIQPISI
jgi:catalase (peroxidase I)